MATRQTTQDWVFRVRRVVRVKDGDSFWLELDTGFRHRATEEIRLHSIDCPELVGGSAYERRQAVKARQFTAGWLSLALKIDGLKLWARTYEHPDNFGRWLGDVWWESDTTRKDLGEALMGAELATQYPTRWHHVYDPNRDTP